MPQTKHRLFICNGFSKGMCITNGMQKSVAHSLASECVAQSNDHVL